MKHIKTKFYFIIILAGGLFMLINSCFKQQSTGGVFVLGGIHQSHEQAKYYTYKKMGEIYQQLQPDILCVETQQKYVDDKSFKATPYDFIKFLIPLAQKDNTPIYGIDWWNNEKGKKWQELQQKAFNDTSLVQEINLIGGMFSLLNEYFKSSNFEEINSKYITNLWKAKSEFKYHILSQNAEYKFITEFEMERNEHIVDNILKIIKENPNKKILIAIGIDHKYYIEKELEKKNIRVYQVENIKQFKN
ncbi:MAG: hypothetical protein KAT68_12945 [Bacteroidales bacterium]|nr:hypothetical protein [Bacteroidales bacterium]